LEEVLKGTIEQWNRCVIGLFPGFKLPYHTVNTIASRVWKHCGLENVMTTSTGFMIFRFRTEAEMQAVLEKVYGCFEAKLLFCNNDIPTTNLIKTKSPSCKFGLVSMVSPSH